MTRILRWLRSERGFASTALVILAMPLIIGAFAFGFDAVRLVWAERYLQGRLDLATQSGAATLYTNNRGALRLLTDPNDPRSAPYVAKQQFIANTVSARPTTSSSFSLLGCSNATISGTGDASCAAAFTLVSAPTGTGQPGPDFDFCTQARGNNVFGLKGVAREQLQTVFLRLLGVKTFNFTVTSQSLVRFANC